MVITGSPAHIEQLDDNGNLMQGNAATLDYDNIKQIAVLTGNASGLTRKAVAVRMAASSLTTPRRAR